MFNHKFNQKILTFVGFCVISPWSFSQFLLNHKKTLLRWLLHLHATFQLISSSCLPCRHDRPSTILYVKIDHNPVNLYRIPTKRRLVWKCALISFLCIPNFSSIRVYVYILWAKMQSVRNEEKEIIFNFGHLYLGISW